jgi:hypothetical protein
MTTHRVPRGIIFATLVTALAAVGATADEATKSGMKWVGESTHMEKTADGREWRRIVTLYNWDSGITSFQVYDKAGTLIETRQSRLGLTPDADELARAYELVWQDEEVQQIRQRQAGLDINGGFTFMEKAGVCAAPARCIQVFLFDGENRVKHMLVDLRTDRIVNHNYIPPRNRGQ